MAIGPIRVKTVYLDDEAYVEFGKYGNGDTAIVLRTEHGEPLTTATVNLEEYGVRPAEGTVLIRNSGENAGLVASLLWGGLLESVGREVEYGFDSNAFECVLAPEYKEYT